METEPNDRIILLGAGNLAWHLGPALKDAGYQILQVFSRTKDNASSLAERLDAQWTMDPGKLQGGAGILLFCVSDRSISDLLGQVDLKQQPMLVHTAGSVPADVFKGISAEYGVLYPLMTFTKERPVDFRHIPICFEGSSAGSKAVLERMAGRLTNRVHPLDSQARKYLHLAGIMAANFTNHMYRLSKDYLQSKGLDFSLLKPLILETASKAVELDPAAVQTGPASRNDREVIQEHIELLKDHPGLQKLYTFVSDSITNHFQP